jgi:hypothetical protein
MFDTLADSYAFHAAFGEQSSTFALALNEYEKSFYLTKAQEEVVLGLYSGKNILGDSFESSEEQRRRLGNLVKEDTLSPITNSSGNPVGIDSKSKFFTLPSDLWFITYEAANLEGGKCESMTTMDVYPVTQDEYHKIKRNPFRGANDRRALRLDLADDVVEIVCKYPVASYYIRYLKKLKPIVLIDLPDGLSIDGETTKQGCELHESLHRHILEQAVKTAINSRRPFARRNED